MEARKKEGEEEKGPAWIAADVQELTPVEISHLLSMGCTSYSHLTFNGGF